jgi:hypothetical protein
MAKMPLAKHNDMIEYLPPDRANQPFSIGILPWRSRCRWSVANAHRAKPPDECLAIGAIAIANNISPVQPPSRKPRCKPEATNKWDRAIPALLRLPSG